MGVSRLPHPKNGHFLLKNGLKMPILGLIHCFLGSGGEFRPPNPILQVLDSKKTAVAWYGARKQVFQGGPTQKMAIFWPKMT